MTEKYRQYLTVFGMAVLIMAISLTCWLRPTDAYSDSERRTLAQLPEISWERIADGKFTSEFETFAQDQFPMRESFRALKSWNALFVLKQKTVNKLYLADGHISKMEYPLSERMTEHAIERFTELYHTYLQGLDPFLAVVPDKNYFLAEKNGYLAMDYEALFAELEEKLPFLRQIDLTAHLQLSDYYQTDTHWRQECITDVAQHIAATMGATLAGDYTENAFEAPFYGVYHGQLALPVSPDSLCYLTNATIDTFTVTSFDSGSPKEVPLYNTEKGAGKDGYELFLGGSHAVVSIENPRAETNRELVLFCDSFGTSIAPLLAQGYAKTTLVDIRYIPSAMVGNFIEFRDQDVLFLYSSMMLNNSSGMK